MMLLLTVLSLLPSVLLSFLKKNVLLYLLNKSKRPLRAGPMSVGARRHCPKKKIGKNSAINGLRATGNRLMDYVTQSRGGRKLYGRHDLANANFADASSCERELRSGDLRD
jgi:hypothetical protein